MKILNTKKSMTQNNYQWHELTYLDDSGKVNLGEFGIDSSNGDVLNMDGVSLNDRGDKIDLFIIDHLQGID